MYTSLNANFKLFFKAIKELYYIYSAETHFHREIKSRSRHNILLHVLLIRPKIQSSPDLE